jgi:porin-like protein
MNNVKRFLLSSAAGLVAVAGAQAADLPVKAKPVEYVKICSLYGAGFFYIPGTDTCIKLGGAVRVQSEWNAGAGGIPVGLGSSTEGPQGAFTRDRTNDMNFRTRIYFSVDARQQTEYGTLRTYFRFGIQQTTPADTVGGATYWDRAFIQFAGFTVGKTLSFFDGVSFATFNYNNPRTMADTGPNGITVWAYTAQFGNGISGTISAEDPNGRTKIVDNAASGGTVWSFGSVGTNSNGLAALGAGITGNGMLFPDVVGTLRVDQAWGSAQAMAAMHDASGGYYGTTVAAGHPSNAFGWAAGAALAINLPTWGATSNVNSQPNVDQFQIQGAYSKGAAGYATNGVGAWYLSNGSNHAAVGWLADGIYSTGSSVELTTAWSIYAGYQHLWTPNWRTSVYGGYLAVSYDGTATTFACGIGGLGGAGTLLSTGLALAAGSPCNINFNVWQAGTRTQWNPVSQLDIGVDVLYSRLDTGLAGATTTAAAALPSKPAGPITFSDQDVWSVMFRVQRNFWP